MDTKKYYYLNENRKPVGPFTKQEFKKLNLVQGTKIWYTGLKQWIDYNPVTTTKAKEQIKCIYNAVLSKIVALSKKTPQIKNKKINLSFSNKKIWLSIASIVILTLVIYTTATWISNIRTKYEIMSEAYDCDEFQMYLEKYYRDIEFFGINKKKPRTIIMKLAPMHYFEKTKDFHGISYGYDDDDIIEIYINEDSWKQFSRPQKYILMYHELSHDILNVSDLPDKPENHGKLMCPVLDRFEKVKMDDFIEMSHELFEQEK